MTDKEDYGLSQAKAQLASIVEMVAALDGDDPDAAQEAIQQAPLSVEVRSDWTEPGQNLEPAEYTILLCTGGPAVRIIGELNRNEPASARIQYQDWYRPWATLHQVSDDEEAALLRYAQQFWYGE